MIENLYRQSPKARSQSMKGSTKGTIRGFTSEINISQKLCVCTTTTSRDPLFPPNIAVKIAIALPNPTHLKINKLTTASITVIYADTSQ